MRGLWTDNRIGGYPRTVHCDSCELMQLPDEVRKLVCFVRRSGAGKAKIGTAFFVADPLGVADETGDELSAIYVVTARHCVQQIDPEDPDDPPVEAIELRLNTVDGRSEWIKTTVKGWIHHPTADVSVYATARHSLHYSMSAARGRGPQKRAPPRDLRGPSGYEPHLSHPHAPGPSSEVRLSTWPGSLRGSRRHAAPTPRQPRRDLWDFSGMAADLWVQGRGHFRRTSWRR